MSKDSKAVAFYGGKEEFFKDRESMDNVKMDIVSAYPSNMKAGEVESKSEELRANYYKELQEELKAKRLVVVYQDTDGIVVDKPKKPKLLIISNERCDFKSPSYSDIAAPARRGGRCDSNAACDICRNCVKHCPGHLGLLGGIKKFLKVPSV